MFLRVEKGSLKHWENSFSAFSLLLEVNNLDSYILEHLLRWTCGRSHQTEQLPPLDTLMGMELLQNK